MQVKLSQAAGTGSPELLCHRAPFCVARPYRAVTYSRQQRVAALAAASSSSDDVAAAAVRQTPLDVSSSRRQSAVCQSATATAEPATAAPQLREESQPYIERYAVPAARAIIDMYAEPEAILARLLVLPDLDKQLETSSNVADAASQLQDAVQKAMTLAYGTANDGSQTPGADDESTEVTAAHTFLQRVLYKINRLSHFWYDDLSLYENERSFFLQRLRNTIEESWQQWETTQLPGGVEQYKTMSIEDMKQRLVDSYHRDVNPEPNAGLRYIRDDMGPLGYSHLLAIGSLDGLVEASRQSKVCAGTANEVSCAVFRVLMEEYGTGRYSRKHSTFYKTMMQELGLNTAEEYYLDLVPWQALANANNNFLLTERRRHYLRYNGGLSFFEINGPSVYRAYLGAAQRCRLSEAACGYWALHIKEDERHGRQMLDEVALPLVDMYPENAWEVMFGYDQEAFLGVRAGTAVVAALRAAEQLATKQQS
eukprot:jgi/Chrzof1/7175/Cz02g13250.t1